MVSEQLMDVDYSEVWWWKDKSYICMNEFV